MELPQTKRSTESHDMELQSVWQPMVPKTQDHTQRNGAIMQNKRLYCWLSDTVVKTRSTIFVHHRIVNLELHAEHARQESSNTTSPAPIPWSVWKRFKNICATEWDHCHVAFRKVQPTCDMCNACQFLTTVTQRRTFLILGLTLRNTHASCVCTTGA